MEFRPSDGEQAGTTEVRCNVPREDAFSELPGTLVHTDSDSLITASISLSWPAGVWSAVKIVMGLVPSDVLHWRLIVPGVAMSKRVSCGHDVPLDCVTGWRISPTVVPRS